MSTKFVIFDCDGGSDDAWALLLLLKAEEEKRLNVLGITVCGCGNTDLQNAARNMHRILKSCDREEIPIYFGAEEALIPPTQEIDKAACFHGKDGFGDVLSDEDDIDIGSIAKDEHAVTAIYRLCKEHPKEVTLIGVGPLTNIALCISMYGKKFVENVKEIHIMGGNHQGVGNFTHSAEFNFYSDPEAAHIVLSKSTCPITILPWEPCMEERFTLCINWRLDDFGKNSEHPAVELLNVVEKAQWGRTNFKSWIPCDAILIAALLCDDKLVQKQSMWHATVVLSGLTRGQMVLDHLHEVDKNPKNVRIIELVNAEHFKHIAQWAAGLRQWDIETEDDITNQNV